MLSPLATPVKTLLFALGGVALAWLWYNIGWVVPVAVVLVVWSAVLALQSVADAWITTRPEQALQLFETRALSVAVVSAAATALVIIATVAIAAPEGTPPAQKEVIGAVASAVTAFVGAVVVSAKDSDEQIGKFVAARFQARFVQDGEPVAPGQVALPVGSEAIKAVFTSYEYGWTDWSHDNRRARIEALQAHLRPTR